MLSLPREVIHAQGSSNLQLSAAAGDSSKQQEANCSVQWLTAFDCAAPIHDAFVFQEPHGEQVLQDCSKDSELNIYL